MRKTSLMAFAMILASSLYGAGGALGHAADRAQAGLAIKGGPVVDVQWRHLGPGGPGWRGGWRPGWRWRPGWGWGPGPFAVPGPYYWSGPCYGGPCYGPAPYYPPRPVYEPAPNYAPLK